MLPSLTLRRRPALWGAAALIALGCTPAGDSPTAPQFDVEGPALAAAVDGPKVVISQVYGAGGNAVTHDYVELYNAGNAAATLDGMSLQYASATGTGSFGSSGIARIGGTLNPGNYYLIQLTGGSAGTPLPKPDTVGAINASATAGKFVLVTGTASLGCNGSSTVCNDQQKARIVDLVGYGGANYYEGTGPAPAASNTLAVFRRSGGAQDTDDNRADFETRAPAPRNSSTNPGVSGPLETVTLPASVSVDNGATTTVSAVASDANGIAITTGTVAWTVDNANVTVTSTGARTASVRGNALGTAVITATLTVDDITRSATTTVTVSPGAEPGAPASVDVTNFPPTPLPIGFEFQVFATIKDAFGATLSAPRNWSSRDPGIAVVDAVTGVIRSTGLGRVYIVSEPAPGVRDSIFVDVADVKEGPAVYANHLEFGLPTDASPDDEYLVEWPQFISSWNRSRGQPNWVAYNLEATHRGPAERCDCFTPDPKLPADFPKVVYTDYTGSGYSRGHMVMSEDRTAGGSSRTTSLDNARTFYMTNIIPQQQANNGGPWLDLEMDLGQLATSGTKEIYILAGGAKYSGTLANSNGKVAIPTWTWKIAVIMPRDQGLANVDDINDLEIIAVSMPNLSSMPHAAWEPYRVTVDSLEKLTGYDFLSLLPNLIENIVESGDRAPSAVISAQGGAEGQVLTFDGRGSSDPDIGGPLDDVLSYKWIVNGHVTSESAVVTGSFPDNGTVNVMLIVTDRFGWADTATTSVAISNVAPQVAPFAGATILQGETYTASSTFADPGQDSWAATVNYGDGSGTQALTLEGFAFSLSHRYTTAGTFTVVATVSDDDTGTDSQAAVVKVESPIEGVSNLDDMVAALGMDALRASTFGTDALRTSSTDSLTAGELQSLRVKLNAAGASLRRGDASGAVGQLSAFVNGLEAMAATGRVDRSKADRIIAYAQRVIRSVQG